MLIERTEVFGFSAAARAMRNPKESWHLSDTRGDLVGSNDLELMIKLIRAGRPHRKFLRQVIVWVDWTLPIYVWSEADTYKVSTVRNSCSTMHRLGYRPLVEADFEGSTVLPSVLEYLNDLGLDFREAKAGNHADIQTYLLREMKAHLPASYLQKATMTLNYETLLAMHHDREHHRLPQWSGPEGICAWIQALPYMEQFIDATRT
jgi:hypothetical protein